MNPAVCVEKLDPDFFRNLDAVYGITKIFFPGDQKAGRNQNNHGYFVMKAENFVVDACLVKFDHILEGFEKGEHVADKKSGLEVKRDWNRIERSQRRLIKTSRKRRATLSATTDPKLFFLTRHQFFLPPKSDLTLKSDE